MTKGNGAVEEFIRERSKMNPDGTIRMLPKTAYLDFFQEHQQISPDVLKGVADGERAFADGMTRVGTQDLVALVIAAKAAGDDPADLVSSVRVSRPNGQLSADIRHTRVTTNPRTRESLVQHGVVIFKARVGDLISKDAAEEAREEIMKQLA